ncbi:MAG: DUF3997 domain-containing protein [Verrucomicrobia bacterium]|nr:DUF3997 domain-containing protein [Verrucomicrobiota bacterium]
MARIARSLFAALACLGILAGCGGFGFAYAKRLSGKYGLVAADVLEQMDISEMLPNGSAIGVIPATVYAVGWNEQFIIAKQNPAGPSHTVDKTATHFYILKVSDGSVTGPINESAFGAERTRLGVPEALTFTLVFDSLK